MTNSANILTTISDTDSGFEYRWRGGQSHTINIYSGDSEVDVLTMGGDPSPEEFAASVARREQDIAEEQ